MLMTPEQLNDLANGTADKVTMREAAVALGSARVVGCPQESCPSCGWLRQRHADEVPLCDCDPEGVCGARAGFRCVKEAIERGDPDVVDSPPVVDLPAAMRAALNELGVPGPGYPQPVKNAVEILTAALGGSAPKILHPGRGPFRGVPVQPEPLTVWLEPGADQTTILESISLLAGVSEASADVPSGVGNP